VKAFWAKLGKYSEAIRKPLRPVSRVLNGPSEERQTFGIAQSLFTRGLGLIYFIAILSWWVQIDGLVGSNGIIPAANYIAAVKQHFATQDQAAFWNIPTVFLIDASDTALHMVCGIGVLIALLVMVGVMPGPLLATLWLLYLSLVTTGGVFMSFQWDILLLEAGFLGILFAPWGQWIRSPYHWSQESGTPVSRVLRRLFKAPRQIHRDAPRWIVFLIGFLLFKLMFFSGVVKIASDETWRTGVALTFHYETQPIPHVMAWYAHQLPVWIQKASSNIMLVIEMGLPFLIFCGRRPRLVAAIGIAGLMLLIMATGNFTYFNLLTILLCIPLLDDRQWPGFMRRWFRPREMATSEDEPTWVGSSQRWSGLGLRLAIGIPILLLSLNVCQRQLQYEAKWTTGPILPGTKALNGLSQATQPFYLSSGYGLFRVMTTKRPEIIIEGSMDGQSWEAYEFRWKPDDRLNRMPPLVAPHQPRMDWQMWFAALGYQYQRSPRTQWFENLMVHIIRGQPEVLQLFAHNPFPDEPPFYLRAKIYHYNFTTPAEKRESGNWWKREELGLYFPVIQRRDSGS